MKIRASILPIIVLLVSALLTTSGATFAEKKSAEKENTSAQSNDKKTTTSTTGTSVLAIPYVDARSAEGLKQAVFSPLGQALIQEVEPNNDFTTAQALSGSAAVVLGNVYPNADVDFYSFPAAAGDRVYAATMTSSSANSSFDTVLDIIGTDGSTILETDLDDGSFGTTSSTVAGTVLSSAGTYFIRARHNSLTNQIRPYHLHFRLQTGVPDAEVEPNEDTGTAQPLPASGWISGSTSSTTDLDFYSLTLNAGDTIYASLDVDPTRDNTQWNAQLGVGIFSSNVLVVNDGSVGSLTNPLSESHFMTVKDAGTYFVLVNIPTGGATFGDYHLSVTVHPAQPQTCTTFTSTDVPVPIPTGPGQVMSTLTIPGNPQIGDLNVTINLTHNFMADLDVTLVSPFGNDNGLFSDIGSVTAGSNTTMNLGLDDEAGIPFAYTVVDGMVLTPELAYRLSWFDGENAGGVWTLVIRDDAAADGGSLDGWSLTVCEPAPPPTCPPGTVQTTVYSSDFEANDGGFTHSGTADEWELGLPAFAPITTCNSGIMCWKTDLDNTYNASSSQDLLSPNIDLSTFTGAAWMTWAQKYQIENATFDHAYLEVRQVGGLNPQRPWEFLDATMTNTVGNPSTTIQESAGWGQFTADISDYLGQNTELLFHLDSDTTVQLTGLAIDDVNVFACLTCPVITLSPATLPDGTVGVPYSQTISAVGGTGPYTFSVTAGTLPQGLSLNPTTGEISGTPTTVETANFTITATDSVNCTGTQAYTVNIVCPVITLSPTTLPNGNTGVLYDQTVVASGGTPPHVYSVSSGTLPTGLTLNPATGQISGTPTVAGTFNFTITATDANNCTGSQAYTINIDCQTITLSPVTLPDGIEGVLYDQTVTASGGTPPYIFSVSLGTLPTGLNLNPATGQISGTPTAAGTFNFTITATDANSCTGSQAYTVNINTACLFCDEFDDSTVGSNWTYIPSIADWSENGTALVGSKTKKTQAHAIPVFSGCTNCIAQTVMRTAGGAFNRVWFLFHVQDKDNLVELLMKEENEKWVLKHRINKAVVAKQAFLSTIDANTDYTVSIRYDGINFIAAINGVDQITLAPGGPVTGGSVGFKLKKTTATFQRIEVN